MLPPFPAANLQDPIWTVREGQAVWQAKRGAPEIAGEVLLATSRDGRTFVQFSKTPFPFVIVQTRSEGWQAELPTQNKRYSGRGKPPKRLIWFYLPKLLEGEAPPRGWTWESLDGKSWRLENRRAGESIEGYFAP
jgi:hypothetical protein